jgi:RNA polymerase sigma-70 factor (ECF subfamily)
VPIPSDLVDQIRTLHGASWGWALACCRRDPVSAEDVLQTAYAKVLSGDVRFEGRSSVRTWMFGVIRVTAHEHRRRAWLGALRTMLFGGAEPPAPAFEPDGAELAERSERAGAIHEALRALSPRQREVIHLVFYEDLTVAEAAEAMGVPVGTARMHYDRGKKRLRAELAKKGVTP